jgi:carboxymethylenebutenolidase
MLIHKKSHDVHVKSGERPMRIFVISPNLPEYPQARFPGALFALLLL